MNTKACLAGLMLGLMATSAYAEAGDVLVRLRAVRLEMDTSSDRVGGAGAEDRLDVNSKWIPELDLSYFFTKHIAAELVLTYPQKQHVYLDGGYIGDFKHLPPSLLVQYHFLPDTTIDPYLGAGVNLTFLSDRKQLGAGNTLGLDSTSFGPALQAGVDFAVTDKIVFNLDVKKVWIHSDVTSNASGAYVSKVKLNPWLLGVGVGYKF